LDSLKWLQLSQNELHFLPETLGNLKKLENLQLNYNWLDSLPESIGGCEKLKFIYLNRNNLHALPESLGLIKGLKEIYLVGAGQLILIPENFCDLRRLELLEIDMQCVLPTCLLVQQTNRLTIIQK
jgi:Leucine-rich repeat (LRR) protein